MNNVWRGPAVGPVTIPNGKTFGGSKAFEKFVLAGWKDLQGKPLQGMPEIQLPPGGRFTIRLEPHARGRAEWMQGLNKQSPFTLEPAPKGGYRLVASRDPKALGKTDVFSIRDFKFKAHNGARALAA
ncbi:MAG: hypothetical protein K1X89_05515 [Myxococcaceae bacterium]|nr:hypothetical protein [Myxococcaceae bacterium]